MSKSAKNSFKEFFKLFGKADIANTSAALAYHTLLALVPLIAFVLWYLKNLGVSRNSRIEVRNFILNQFDFGGGEEFLKVIERLSSNVSTKGLSYVIVGILLYTTFNLARRSGDALDRVLSLNLQTQQWSLTRKVLMLTAKRGFALCIFPLFLLASLFISSWLKEDSWFQFLFQHKTVGPWLARPIPWLIDAFAIFLLYLLIPIRSMGIQRALQSALLAAPLFELSKYLFTTYSKQAIAVQKIYGALASIPMFIIWIQLAWLIVLIAPLITGYLANSQLLDARTSRTDWPPLS